MNTTYKLLQDEIAQIARDCGRDPNDVKIVAVVKKQPVEAVQALYAAGCRDVAENRVQEAFAKMPLCSPELRWHLIGTLQANKVRKVIGRFCCIHSVDDFELAQKISVCSIESHVITPVLLQVNTSGEASKHGWSVDQWRKHMDVVRALPGIEIRGLMTMAPFGVEEKVIRECFRRLREFRDELGLKELSMGMSSDYAIAIQEGATLVRIGSALFN